MGTVIISTESVNARFRPKRSPMRPKNAPPATRMIEPAANTPKLAIFAVSGSSRALASGVRHRVAYELRR
jgi:hypothetical protein